MLSENFASARKSNSSPYYFLFSEKMISIIDKHEHGRDEIIANFSIAKSASQTRKMTMYHFYNSNPLSINKHI